MIRLQDIFADILCCGLCGTPLSDDKKQQLNNKTVGELYSLANQQDLSHIVAAVVRNGGVDVSEELKMLGKRLERQAVYRLEMINHVLAETGSIFSSADIDYIPLKGSVIREYYKEPYLRTSGDIDILIRENDTDSAVGLLTKNGYKLIKKNYHDILFHAPNGVHIELHYSICENVKKTDKILQNAWSYVQKTDGGYKFTDEFFLFYLYAHAHYHFLQGGCGVRTLMDIAVLKNVEIDIKTAEKLLCRAGIYKFAYELEKLTDTVFSSAPRDKFYDILLGYIMEGGTHGSTGNKAAVKKRESKSNLKYILSRIFMPYSQMKIRYPALEKAPFLLPAFWVVRLFGILFKGDTKRIMSETKIASDLSDTQIDEVNEICQRLEI